jgi:transposase InsO family protein
MSQLYQILEISKQAFHQSLDRELKRRDEQMQLLPIIQQIRKDHPRLSCREMYFMLRPEYMGRDHFERFCYKYGFKVPQSRRFYHTTDSFGVTRFPNLLLEIEKITGINQVWVSDITYYQLQDQVFYITLIMDLFSRQIVGYRASNTLRTEETTLKALKMAVQIRGISQNSNLIIHSDGGGQYYSKEFRKLTEYHGMRNSMCESVYENANAERINGTIKNAYLKPYSPQSFCDLEKMLIKAVHLYNNEKPHQSIDRCTPAAFEKLTALGLLTKTWVINKRKKVTKKEKVNISIISV